MKSRIALIGAGATPIVLTTLLVATPATAQEGYDAPDSWPSPVKEHPIATLLIDRLEYAYPDKSEDTLAWDFRAWYGGDTSRVYLKGEGGNVQGNDEDAEFESLDLLYSRLIADFWELQGGIGYQGGIASNDHPERYFGVISLLGVAPYRFETDLNLRISDAGDVSASLESEYNLRLTQRMFLQPRIEASVAASEAPTFGVGRGLNSLRAGMRLRYEISRSFAPYIGGYWQKSYGDTADLARAAGGTIEDSGIVTGVKMWF